MEIMKNLWQVGGDDLTAPEDAAIYLIRFEHQAALIDAGCGRAHDRLVANISKVLPESVQITYLFLTHCHYDHVGGAVAIRDRYGCKIVTHTLDAVYLESANNDVTAASWYGAKIAPLKIDHKIRGRKESFKIDSGEIMSYHCPGHSPGSVVYMVEFEKIRVLFGQDVHGPLDPSLLSNSEDYIRSLKFLLSLNADILCEGHFGVFKGKKKIEKFIKSYIMG
ncbi:MAG: MBL fold metallo-hydrolase [Deltaproteobacteria bacterium]|nr:MBL fold metallo-hydrolase [Deltaproteobacteria bacterium]